MGFGILRLALFLHLYYPIVCCLSTEIQPVSVLVGPAALPNSFSSAYLLKLFWLLHGYDRGLVSGVSSFPISLPFISISCHCP